MPDKTILLAAAIMAAVTAAVRAAPFVLFARRKTPAVLTYLGRCLPCAVMGMLVVYCLRGMSFTSPGAFLPEALAGAVVVGSYAWKRNTLLSILGGTVCYMLLVQLVFV